MRVGRLHRNGLGRSGSDEGRRRPLVSFVVPVFNASANIERVLKAVRRAGGANAEVIVVDDASLDDSATRAAPLADLVVRRPCQGGAARARNDGAEHALGDVLVFVDSDVVVTPESVRGLLELISAGADAAFGSYTPLPPPECRNVATTFKNLIHQYTHQVSARDAATFWSGFGAVSSRAFDAVEGFDPAVTASADVEDIHLGYRLTSAGYRIVLDPSLQVEHLKRYTLREMMLSDFWHRAIPWTRAMLELRTFKADLSLRHSSMVSSAVSWLVLVSAGAAVVFEPRIAIVTVALGASWLALNAPFLAYVRRAWSFRGALASTGILFLVYLYASIGALAGVAAYALRHDRRSIRNRLPLRDAAPAHDGPSVTVALLAGDMTCAPALAMLDDEFDCELLVVGSTEPETLPKHARYVAVAPGTSRCRMAQAALDAATGRSLALLHGEYVPDPGWLDRVRSASEQPFVMVGGSFEPGDEITDRAFHLARLWPWRSTTRASWLTYHPENNAVIDVEAAHSVGGFGPEGALLLRLSGFGARPVLFDPLMQVHRSRPPSARDLTVAQAGPARHNTAAWTRYLDYSVGHRAFLSVVTPLRVLLRMPRRLLQALWEGRADGRLWLSTPLAFLSNACSVVGDVVGLLAPGGDPRPETAVEADVVLPGMQASES
jgi:glycosyltransferase involved in cell wall biosynthesis